MNAAKAVPMVRTAARAATTATLVTAAVALVLAAVAVASGQWHARPVLSGSMEPTVQTGALTLVQRVPAGTITVGDVIVFHPPGDDRLVMHRVIERSADGALRTKGDANGAADPWTIMLRDDTAYVVRADVDWVGYAAVAARGETGRWLLVGAGALLMARAARLLLRRGRPSAKGDPGKVPA